MSLRKFIDIVEGASGYIAKNSEEAKDPRFSTGLTKDVKPGEIDRQANKFGNEFPPPVINNKAAKNSTPNKLMNMGLTESRGITAREPGDQYVNVTNPKDILTIQQVTVFAPKGKDSFASNEHLMKALANAIPPKATRIDDNKFDASSKAAIIAQVIDTKGKPQYWVRYITNVPATTVHGKWLTLRGYRLNTARSKNENISIKPSDIIMDEKFRGQAELAAKVKIGVREITKDTPDAAIADIIDQAVDLASSGKVAPIPNGTKYSIVISKYGSEYLGPLALLSGKFVGGDIPKAMKSLGIKSFAGSKVKFSHSTQQELWDSLIRTHDGKEIQISTKMHVGGGAASSLVGILNQVTPEIEKEHPRAVQIMRYFAQDKSDIGVVKAAIAYNLIDEKTGQDLLNIPRNSKNINDVKNPKLKAFIQTQGVRPGTLARPDYRIFYHALSAAANKSLAAANADTDFTTAMLKALNNNNYLQLITKTTVSGDSISLDYYGKYPTEFTGRPALYNKTYFATGQKGRMGFRLLKGNEPIPIEDPVNNIEPTTPTSEPKTKRKPVDISAARPKRKTNSNGVGRSKRK